MIGDLLTSHFFLWLYNDTLSGEKLCGRQHLLELGRSSVVWISWADCDRKCKRTLLFQWFGWRVSLHERWLRAQKYVYLWWLEFFFGSARTYWPGMLVDAAQWEQPGHKRASQVSRPLAVCWKGQFKGPHRHHLWWEAHNYRRHVLGACASLGFIYYLARGPVPGPPGVDQHGS